MQYRVPVAGSRTDVVAAVGVRTDAVAAAGSVTDAVAAAGLRTDVVAAVSWYYWIIIGCKDTKKMGYIQTRVRFL